MEKDREIEIENRLTDSERRHKVSEKRIDKIENNQEALMEMSKNIAIIAEQNKYQTEAIKDVKEDLGSFKKEVKQDMSSLKKDFDDIKDKPSKENSDKWEKFKWLIVASITTGIVGFILGKVLNLA